MLLDLDNPVSELDAPAMRELVGEQDDALMQIWASWCGPCKAKAPVKAGIARERPWHAVASVEIGNPSLPLNDDGTRQVAVKSVPTFARFRKRKDIAGFAGTTDATQFAQLLG